MNLKQWITYYLMKRDYKRLNKSGKLLVGFLKMSPEDYRNQFNKGQG